MPTATITPEFIDPPTIGKSGKAGPAHVKANNVRYDFWTRAIPMDAFTKGVTVEIEYEEKQNGQYLNREIKRIITSQVRPVRENAPPSEPRYSNPQRPETIESMCVWSLTCAYIASNSMAFEEAYATAKMNYANSRGNAKIAQTEAELDDTIPMDGWEKELT